MTVAAPAADLSFLAGGGEMAARIRAHDWAATPLGPIEGWPDELRTALGLCLSSSFPTAIYWGPELRLLYNDAWAPIPADRHPWALGRPGRDVWQDIWEVVGPQFDAVLARGEAFASYDQMLPIVRSGVPQETYWNYSLTPIRAGDGSIAGVFNQGNETTRAVLGERARQAEDSRLKEMFAQAPVAVALLTGPDHVFAFANEAYLQLVGHRDIIGRTVAEAVPEVVGQGIVTLLDNVIATGRPYGGTGVPVDLIGDDGMTEQRVLDFTYHPTRDSNGLVTGVLVQATDMTARARSEAALRRAKDEREFVLALAERQRARSDPDDVMQVTAEAVAEYLGVDRAVFWRVIDETEIEFGACWTNGRLPPLVGRYRASLFGTELVEASRAGTILAYGNVARESGRTPEIGRMSGASSALTVPLRRQGRWEASFAIATAAERRWTSDEIALAEEAAQLCWDAVARARAVAEIRALNATLADEVRRRTAERDRLWQVSSDLLGIAMADGTWLSVNPAWERALGWKTHELIGRSSRWIMHPDDLFRLDGVLARVTAGEDISGHESRLLTTAGTYRTLSWSVRFDEGMLVASARDVTEERRQQEALARAEERTRLVLEAISGVGVWTLDFATRRFFSEGNLAALYGFSPEEAAAGVPIERVLERIHPDDLERVRRNAADGGLLDDGEIEYRLLQPDGGVRWILTRNHVVNGENRRPEALIGVAVDVTEQRLLEDRLRQSQKMEAVGQLTGGLAHDFNNLLTGISGALEMLQLRIKQGRLGDTERYLTTAHGAVTRAAGLTHRLLAFARRQTLDPRPTDVNRLVEGMAELIRRTVGATVEVKVILSPDLWPALVDPGQLENALLNLCLNARDAMPEGGSITVRTENLSFDVNAAAMREVMPGDYLGLSVSDTGTGMSDDVKARAFDPFFTTKPIGEGTGLGLSMIYGFARQSGGLVRIDSAIGEGTIVTIKLPRHRGPADAPAAPLRAVQVDATQSGSVLVVDDEPAVRALVTDLLAELGYSVIAAVDSVGALAILRSDANLDLLVTDVGLPGGMNGRQLADAARELRPELPTIFITGFAENAVFGARPLEPNTAIVTKPFTMQHLASRVREMLENA